MDIDNYNELHLELTSKCSLKCPQCPRTEHLGEYKVTEMSMNQVRRIINTNKVYEAISLCGDHGDPIYHSQFHSILSELVNMKGQPRIIIATNGSYKSEEWWHKTASILRLGDQVIFGIDGLEDTNSLYRVNSDWKSIMIAMKTLRVNLKITITWQWILFQYNENQLKEAYKIAKEVGLNKFLLIKSSRYDENTIFKTPTISLSEAECRLKG